VQSDTYKENSNRMAADCLPAFTANNRNIMLLCTASPAAARLEERLHAAHSDVQ
jgi:hypothetical protein